jgi:hypothetical protein
MVSSGQIVNIALVIGGAYVIITYGPQIITSIKKSIDDMKTAAGAGGTPAPEPTAANPSPGPDFMTGLPQPTTQEVPFTPFPEPGGDTTTAPDYNQPAVIPSPQYSSPTTNAPIDSRGLVQQYPTVPSPQNPTKGNRKKKGSSKTPPPTTITKQQRQQEHLQNTQTSTGQPVTPPHIQVSQAHPSRPGVSGPTVESRFQRGTPARSEIDYQLGCNCAGTTCCFRGRKCDGTMGAECTHATSAAKPATDAACASIRQRFLANNPCNKPASAGRTTTKYPPIRPAPGFRTQTVKGNAGFALGDTGDLISLDSMFVTIA